MSIPAPEPGMVISYAYLWRYEHEAGYDEGRKNRPCVIVLSVEQKNESRIVTVAPIPHRQPAGVTIGIELPPRVKQHLGLDHETSWVILSEVNQFVWPGFDLRPVPGSKNRFDYGFLPPKFFDKIRSGILDLIVKRRAGITKRD